MIPGPPTIYQSLLAHPERDRYDLSSLRLAVTELAGLSGAQSQSREGAKKVVLFLTDGLPTFPIGAGSVADPGDTEAALTAARLAHKALSARLNKTDSVDAEGLAHLARTGWYRAVHIKDESSDQLRMLIGARERLLRSRPLKTG